MYSSILDCHGDKPLAMTGGKKAATAGFFRIIEKLAEARVMPEPSSVVKIQRAGLKQKSLPL